MDMQTTAKPKTPGRAPYPSKPKGWRTIVKGNHTVKTLELSNPSISMLAKRIYPLADSRLYFIILVAPPSLRADDGTPSELAQKSREVIETRLHNCQENLRNETNRIEKLLEVTGTQAGVGSGFEITVYEVHTPLSKNYLQCFEDADLCMRLIDTAWIEGIFSDEQRLEAERRVRKIVTGVATIVDQAFIPLLRALQEVRTASGKPLSAAEVRDAGGAEDLTEEALAPA